MNVLIGPNGSGKSNLLRAIELLQEAGVSDLDNAIVRQGGIGALLWDGQAQKIGWQITVIPLGAPIFSQYLSLRYELSLLSQRFLTGYSIEREILEECPNANAGDSLGFEYFRRDLNRAVFFHADGQNITATPDRLEERRTLLSQTSSVLSNQQIFLFREYLKSWRIYQDFAVHQDSAVRKSAITRRESRLSPNGNNLVTALHTLYSTERGFRDQLIDAMRAAFGSDFEELEFPPAEDQRIQMRVRWKSLTRIDSAADLSDGTLKFLMLIAILANPSRGDLVAIDEPEIYLHPSMFPVIAELAVEAAKTSQIIFTTHSPEFLTAIGTHNPITAVLQNVEGETKLNVLDQHEMKRWLEKYKLGELFVSGDLEALV